MYWKQSSTPSLTWRPRSMSCASRESCWRRSSKMPTGFGVEIVGLKSYAKRQGPVGRPRTQRRRRSDLQPQSGSWRAAGPDLGLMSRSDAVLTVMRSLPGPADRNMIHEQLVDGDRFDSIDDISLTLSGLKRSGRAEKLGQGLWQVADETAAAEVR